MAHTDKQVFLSIVTVVRSDRKGLEITFASVASQTARHQIQMIVIDGSSNDDTLLATRGFEVDVLISEADTGLYDAMNKGLSHATGRHVYFLNSGDSFDAPETVEKVLLNFKDTNSIYYCSVEIKSNKDTWLSTPLSSKYFDYDNYLPHNQSIYYPACFYQTNRYNLKYKVQADIDFTARAARQCGKVFIPICISQSILGGYSCQQYTSFKKSLSLAIELHNIYMSQPLNHKYL